MCMRAGTHYPASVGGPSSPPARPSQPLPHVGLALQGSAAKLCSWGYEGSWGPRLHLLPDPGLRLLPWKRRSLPAGHVHPGKGSWVQEPWPLPPRRPSPAMPSHALPPAPMGSEKSQELGKRAEGAWTRAPAPAGRGLRWLGVRSLPCEPQLRVQPRGGVDTSTSLPVPFGQRQTPWGPPRDPPASFVGGSMAGGLGTAFPHFWPFPGSCRTLSPRGAARELPAQQFPPRQLEPWGAPGGLSHWPPALSAVWGAPPPRSADEPRARWLCSRAASALGTAVRGGICCSRRGRWAASELSVCGGGCHRNPFPPERGGGRGRRLLVGQASGE